MSVPIADQIRVGAPDPDLDRHKAPGPARPFSPGVMGNYPVVPLGAAIRLTDEEMDRRIRCVEIASDLARAEALNSGSYCLSAVQVVDRAAALLKFIKGE